MNAKKAAKTITAECREVGARIKKMRDAQGLTNRQVANHMGVTEAAAKKLITGETATNFLKLIPLARLLGCTPNAILGVNDSGTSGDINSEIWIEVIDEIGLQFGLSEANSRMLAETVVRVITGPPIPHAGIDPRAAVRIQVATAIRVVLPQAQLK
jgi:transcriptional regulator with XRE-family HTH domain